MTPNLMTQYFFANKVRDAEDTFLRAQQSFPEDAEFLQVEARLYDILREKDSAVRALERAWTAGPRGSGTAIRLAKAYDANERHDEAYRILKEALSRDPDDKTAHHSMAMHYLSRPDYDAEIVGYHLRKSFSSDDQNFEYRYILAQFLFLQGSLTEASDLFEKINTKAPITFRQKAPREDNIITGKLGRFTGSIETLRDGFMFIRSGAYPSDIFCHFSGVNQDVLDAISLRQPVNFRVRFNRAGPTAVDLALGRL